MRYKVLRAAAISEQHQMNPFLLACMSDLTQICKTHGIRHAFLKGLGVSYEVYDPPASRISRDVDILIHISDAEHFLSLLLRSGFHYKEGGNALDRDPMMRIRNGHHHLRAIYKEYEIRGKVISIALEIHVFPFECSYEFLGHARRDDDYTAEVLDRTRQVSIGDEVFSVPSPTDHLYIMAMHMISHQCLDTILYLFVKKPFKHQNVTMNLVDIALFAHKHKDSIQPDLLCDLANRHGNHHPLQYTLRLIEWLFPGVDFGFPVIPCNELPQTPLAQVCRLFRQIPPEDYLFSSNLKASLDSLVGKLICQKIDYAPSGFEITTQNNCITITTRNLRPGNLYSINVYSPEAPSEDFEYILQVGEDHATLSKDDGYRFLWDPATFGICQEDELSRCYYETDSLPLADQLSFTIPGGINARVHIQPIHQVNPFTSKEFI
ncbi:MAG: nucleotidyltransferase family protein [Clostridia bacterium]|nr:nucleotidyltransferase family protein [Clostridia bacterium]